MTDQDVKITKMICITIVLCIFLMFSIPSTYYYYVHAAAFDAGYSQQTLLGTPGVHWVKDEE